MCLKRQMHPRQLFNIQINHRGRLSNMTTVLRIWSNVPLNSHAAEQQEWKKQRFLEGRPETQSQQPKSAVIVRNIHIHIHVFIHRRIFYQVSDVASFGDAENVIRMNVNELNERNQDAEEQMSGISEGERKNLHAQSKQLAHYNNINEKRNKTMDVCCWTCRIAFTLNLCVQDTRTIWRNKNKRRGGKTTALFSDHKWLGQIMLCWRWQWHWAKSAHFFGSLWRTLTKVHISPMRIGRQRSNII